MARGRVTSSNLLRFPLSRTIMAVRSCFCNIFFHWRPSSAVCCHYFYDSVHFIVIKPLNHCWQRETFRFMIIFSVNFYFLKRGIDSVDIRTAWKTRGVIFFLCLEAREMVNAAVTMPISLFLNVDVIQVGG